MFVLVSYILNLLSDLIEKNIPQSTDYQPRTIHLKKEAVYSAYKKMTSYNTNDQ